MNFDYYAATLPATTSHCQATIIENFKGVFAAEKPVSPYKIGIRHVEAGFRLYWGGENPLPFFVSSGRSAVQGADFVRTVYPSHRVSRIDVAVDFNEVGGFDRVRSLLDPIARQRNVDLLFMGDPDPATKTGRTMYYGSPTSDVRICLYEKGLREARRGSETAAEGWTRLELRVRPRKERKSLAARSTASELWGFSKWSSEVADKVLHRIVPFTPDPSIRRSASDNAIDHMMRQYGARIAQYISQHGRPAFDALIDGVCADDKTLH